MRCKTAQERHKTTQKEAQAKPQESPEISYFENTCNHLKTSLWITPQGQAAGVGGGAALPSKIHTGFESYM
jgi:hypothetical protein